MQDNKQYQINIEPDRIVLFHKRKKKKKKIIPTNPYYYRSKKNLKNKLRTRKI